MKKKIVAAFCLAMVMTVGGCSGAGTAAQPESSESQTQSASVSESSSSSDASEENSTQKSASSTASSDAADASSSRDIFAMDTYMTVTAYGPNAETAVDQAQQEIERLDALLSTGEETSEVAQINANGGALGGRPLEMVLVDDTGTPTGAVNAVINILGDPVS